MEQLKGLIKILNKSTLDQLKLLVDQESKDSKIWMLYEGIHDRSFQTDEEARKQLHSGEHSSQKYFYTKHTLKNSLINQLFLLPNKFENEKLKTEHAECYKRLAAVVLLETNGQKALAISLAEEIIKKSVKYEFTDLTHILAQKLSMYFALAGHSKKRKQYQKEFISSTELVTAESSLWALLVDIYSATAMQRQLDSEEKERFIFDIIEVVDKTKNLSSYKTNLLRFNLEILRYHLKEDFQMVIATSRNAISFFDNLPYPAGNKAYFNFYFKMIPVLIFKQSFSECEDILSRCFNNSKSGDYNWNIALVYQSILGFHSKNYQLVKTSIQEVIGQENNLPKNLKEQWRIIDGYLFLLNEMGKINFQNHFKIGRFLNEVPLFTKDKKGANIAILTLQILIFLSKGQTGKIADRVASLNAYTHKYLRKNKTFRSSCFIKILMQLPASGFHKIAFLRKSRNYFTRLKSVPLFLNDIEIELIPYEELYQFILELLEKRGSY